MAFSRPDDNTTDLSVSVLANSFTPLNPSAPNSPVKVQPKKNYTDAAVETPISSHMIFMATKENVPSTKPAYYIKINSTDRMAEIEACAAQFMSVLIPGKVPSVHALMNTDEAYQYVGVASKKMDAFIPYFKKPLTDEALQLPQYSLEEKEKNNFLLRQAVLSDKSTSSSLIGKIKELKAFYDHKYKRKQEEPAQPTEQSTGWGSWSFSLTKSLALSTLQIIGDVTQSTKGLANYYKIGTSAALAYQLQTWLDNKNPLSSQRLRELKRYLQERENHLQALGTDHSGLNEERPLLADAKKFLSIKETELKRFSHAAIRNLEQIHSQIKKLGWASNEIIAKASETLFTQSDVLNQSMTSPQANTLAQEMLSAISLLDLLKATNIQQVSTEELIASFKDKNRELPCLTITLQEYNGEVTPTYEFKPVKNLMALIDLISHLENKQIIPTAQADKIKEALANNNLASSTLALAQLCPGILQTSIKNYSYKGNSLEFTAQDVDNYAMKKGLAEGLIASYLFKEGDNHACNMDRYGNRIDNDMTLWDIGHTYKLPTINYIAKPQEVYDVAVRTPTEKSFAITAKDILHFPDIQADGYYYWPTKDASVRKTVKHIFTTYSANNEFTGKDNELFKQLASDPTFIFHKFKTLLKFTLIDYSIYENIAYANIRNDIDNGHLINQIKTNVSNRIEEVKRVLQALPQYEEFLHTDGIYALELINDEFLAQKEALLKKLASEDISSNKHHFLESCINSLNSSIEALEHLQADISVKHRPTPSNSSLFSMGNNVATSSNHMNQSLPGKLAHS